MALCRVKVRDPEKYPPLCKPRAIAQSGQEKCGPYCVWILATDRARKLEWACRVVRLLSKAAVTRQIGAIGANVLWTVGDVCIVETPKGRAVEAVGRQRMTPATAAQREGSVGAAPASAPAAVEQTNCVAVSIRVTKPE